MGFGHPALVVDTSGSVTSLVLVTGPGQWLAASSASGRSQASDLLPMGSRLLEEAGIEWGALRGLAVVHGPGSFTGLRIGVGFVQGLATALGLRVMLISAFEAVARWFVERRGIRSDAVLEVLFDARLGESYRALVQWRPSQRSLQLVGDPAVVVASQPIDGVERVEAPDHTEFQSPLTTCPNACSLAGWAATVMVDRMAGTNASRHLVDVAHAQPLYVRERVAQTIEERQSESAMCLRPMQLNDLASIMVIENQAYPHPWTTGNFKDSLAAGYVGEVLVDQGVMVGYLVWMRVVDEAHLLNFTIAPARHRRGLGQWMLMKWMDGLRALGVERVLLEVRPSNRAALRLYQRNGFGEIGMRKGYYPDSEGQREDALVLARGVRGVPHRESVECAA